MANLDKTDCIPQYLALDIASSKKLYEDSTTLLDELKQIDANIDKYLQNFIDFNNAKSAPQPVIARTASLNAVFNNINKLPSNVALFWYKKIQDQLDVIKDTVKKVNKDIFSDLSDSIGSLSNAYISYNDNTTPYYSYAIDNIRPSFYATGNTFNKLDPRVYANLISASKMCDAVFKHNLAPMSGEDVNLVQSTNVVKAEGNDSLYENPYCKTTHGDNLVTDVSGVAVMNLVKVEIRKQIRLVYKTLYNVINAIKSRALINTTYAREVSNMIYSSATRDDLNNDNQIYEMFDLLQHKINEFDSEFTNKSQLR